MHTVFNPAQVSREGLVEQAQDPTAPEGLIFAHAKEGKPLATPWQVASLRATLLAPSGSMDPRNAPPERESTDPQVCDSGARTEDIRVMRRVPSSATLAKDSIKARNGAAMQTQLCALSGSCIGTWTRLLPQVIYSTASRFVTSTVVGVERVMTSVRRRVLTNRPT